MIETPTTPPASPERSEPPSGPAAAALLSAGLGALVLGILTTWAEVSSGLKDWLTWDDGIGTLSGKTVVSTIAFVVFMVVLGSAWKNKNPALIPIVIATVVLLVVAVVLTFPTFFQAFA